MFFQLRDWSTNTSAQNRTGLAVSNKGGCVRRNNKSYKLARNEADHEGNSQFNLGALAAGRANGIAIWAALVPSGRGGTLPETEFMPRRPLPRKYLIIA